MWERRHIGGRVVIRTSNPRLLAVGLVAVLVAACSSPSASIKPSASAQPSGSAEASHFAATPLDGVWITRRLGRDDFRAALAKRGFEASLDDVWPVGAFAEWAMIKLEIGDGLWIHNDIGDGMEIGGLGASRFELVDASTARLPLEDGSCTANLHFAITGDSLEFTVIDTSCPDDLAILVAEYESAPFHLGDLTGLVHTEPPGAPPSSNPEASSSSDRLSLRPLGSVPEAKFGFAEYLPPGYGAAPAPLLIELHGTRGSGRGDEFALTQLLTDGVAALINEDHWPDARPFVVLMPQTVEDSSHCFDTAAIEAFLAFALANYQVDPTRVYLTGHSCGANAAWTYLGAHTNEVVAAAVLIAANGYGGIDEAGCDLGRVAIWAVHGGRDWLPVHGSEYPIAFLQRCTDPPALDARLTVYESSEHEVWSVTYRVSTGLDIWAWLLGHSL